MLKSNETNCTHITNTTNESSGVIKQNNLNYNKFDVEYITKRSIGIQLSRQSTPRLTTKNTKKMYKQNKTFDNCVMLNENSSTSTSVAQTTVDGFTDEFFGESGTDDGLEYDYYEPPPLLGSFLCSLQQSSGTGEEFELITEIDIDNIIQHETRKFDSKLILNHSKNLSYENQLNNLNLKQDAYTQISDSIENVNSQNKYALV